MSKTFGHGRALRTLLVGLMLVLALGVLAACGGPSGTGSDTASSAGPDQRVKDFTNDMIAALNDPKITEEATRNQWIDKLAGYFRPADREAGKQQMSNALMGMGSMSEIPGVGPDLKLQFSVDNLQTKIKEQTDTTAQVELTGNVKLNATGTGAEIINGSLPPEGAPITDATGGGDNVSALEKVDGVWYLVAETPAVSP